MQKKDLTELIYSRKILIAVGLSEKIKNLSFVFEAVASAISGQKENACSWSDASKNKTHQSGAVAENTVPGDCAPGPGVSFGCVCVCIYKLASEISEFEVGLLAGYADEWMRDATHGECEIRRNGVRRKARRRRKAKGERVLM